MSLTQHLIRLFHIEGQLRGLRRRLDAAQRYLDAQNRRVEELQEQRRELEALQRQTQATIANLETETAGLDERLEKLRDELNAATTNKQYTAVLTELNTVKLSRSELEDRELQEMERVDQNKQQLEELAAQIAEREKLRDAAQAQLQERREEVGDRLAELEVERVEAARDIPAAEMKVFNDMAEAYDGEAMAQVEEIDRRQRVYACGACNMEVPFQVISELLGSGEGLVRCTACGRILHLHEETRGALAKK